MNNLMKKLHKSLFTHSPASSIVPMNSPPSPSLLRKEGAITILYSVTSPSLQDGA